MTRQEKINELKETFHGAWVVLNVMDYHISAKTLTKIHKDLMDYANHTNEG